jgi:flagellar motor switch protein FliM
MADTPNLLTPEELEALATGIEDGSIETDTGLNGSIKAIKHDLANEDSSLGMNLGVINVINERFVRYFKTGILEVLRSGARVTAEKVVVMPYRDYIGGLSAPTALNTVNLGPLQGNSLVVMDPAIIFTALDNFFGGPGGGMTELSPTRGFTPTEVSFNKIITNVLFGSLQEAWAPVLPIKCVNKDLFSNPAAVKLTEQEELVVVSRFTTELGDKAKGNIDIVYLYSTLKPIRESLESRVQASSEISGSKISWTAGLMAAAMDAEVDIKVVLGEIASTFKDFEEMCEGDIIYFKKPAHAKVRANGIAIFKGDIGTKDAHMAVQFVGPLAPST